MRVRTKLLNASRRDAVITTTEMGLGEVSKVLKEVGVAGQLSHTHEFQNVGPVPDLCSRSPNKICGIHAENSCEER
jgi:hypothetical protein